ncbi:hypothetical protein LSTR_LSTR009495 [Laodelphax striatellus]|uniref:Pericentriolar material 1 protein C-terminal domain-containing protein n=1 Tax=Laodelphax striatellus TaxID=195883 RepID=A0A482WE71_LAOST|nr:hypothetical protein LSTR_LSTR009495 [Laodelphax striatellus]
MAPGLNGGGRPTGTVPKTKSHNESTREHSAQPHRRDFSFNHMNNNLAPADWQSLADFMPVARSRKESNNSSTRYPEPNEIQDEAAVCPESQWFPPVLQPQVNYCNEDEQAISRWEDKRRKSNNILNPPDQAQMNRRFVQICDYINQTSSLMDTLQPSGSLGAENGLPESNFTQGASATSPDTMHQRNFPSQPTGSVPKSSDSTLRRNELKMKMEESQRKVLELREQSAIMALKHKAQEQLKEAQTAQRAWLAAASSTQLAQPSSATALSDANIQDSLHNLQRFYDGRNEIGEMLGCNSDCTSEVVQLQNKLKELQLKKSQMDQKILQYASFNTNLESGDVGNMANGGPIHVGEQNIEEKIAELAVLREQLNRMQGVIAAIPALNTSQESETDDSVNLRAQQGKQDNRTQAVSHGSPAPSMAMTSANIQAKSLRLREARSRLHHLQELLSFVEKLRDSGKPVPERILAVLNNASGFSDEDCMPLMDMSENSFQDLYQEVAAAVASDKQRQPVKPNNTTAKLRARTQQLEEWMKKDDLMSSINTDINSQAGFSYQETPTTATWDGSTRGTMEDHNTRSPDFSSDGETENGASFMPVMNKASSAPTSHKESTSCTNIARDVGIDSASISGVNGASSGPPPQNTWSKQSSAGSGASMPHGIWTPSSSFITQQPNRQENASSSEEISPNPDNRWIAQHILQMQAQLQQVCQNVTDKHHNIPMMSSPGNMWLPPFYPQNGPGFGGFNQFVASQQHQQQQQLPINQLLVNSLNQCCQMIWHQQCELMAVKEAIQLIQQQQHHHHGLIEPDLAPASSIDHNADASRSNLDRATRSPPVLPPHPHPHYFYPPYGNNLNFESFQHHSSPVGTFLPSPAGALNNQVPPGNRANNYWDNFRSYSRQNLLSVRSKTNEGLLTGERERTQDPNAVQSQPNHQAHHHPYPMQPHPPVDMMTFNLSQNHKEKLNTHQSLGCEQVGQAMAATAEQPVRCSSNKPSQPSFHQNNCSDTAPQPETISKGACKKIRAEKVKEQAAAPSAGESSSMIRSWNSLDESGKTTKSKRHLRNTVSTEDLPRNSNFKRKADCKINPIRSDNNSEQMDSLEEAFYSEVAALISVNERQINYLLQLFRDLKHLNSDSDRQAALITIHNLATRACAAASQQGACCVKESQQQIESMGPEEVQEPLVYQESQPRNLVNCKESTPMHNLSNSCSKLDWEIRGVSVAMLPFLKAHFGGICGPSLLEEIRNFVLHLIPPQFRQDQLITSLEGALLKFQGCRLRDVYLDLLGIVADVLINDVTFHRSMLDSATTNNKTNIINNNNNETNGDILLEEGAEGEAGEEEMEEEEEEGAVGGVLEGAAGGVATADDSSQPTLLSGGPPPVRLWPIKW